MDDHQTANRYYLVRTTLFMGSYAAVNIAAIFGAFDHVRQPSAWVLSLIVSAPVIGQIWATLVLMRDSDEFVRALTARRFIIAAGIAMAAFCAWGFMETYAHAAHAPGWLIFPLFWAAFALVSPFIQNTHR